MADTVYNVRDPSGAMRQIRGPEGATDEQVIAKAQELFGSAAQVANDAITRGAKENASWIPSAAKPFLKVLGEQGLFGGSPMGMMTNAGVKGASDLIDKSAYGAGGAVTDMTGSPALGTAANVAVQAIPMVAGGELAKGAAPAFRLGAEYFMRSALKPNAKSVLQGKADKAIATLLDDGGGIFPGHNVTPGGMSEIQAKSAGLNQQMADILRQSNTTVDKGAAGSRMQSAISQMEGYNPTPQGPRAQMEAVADQFHGNPLVPDQIPLPQANQYKQGIYKMLGDSSYGELSTATKEAQKALARGLKEELELGAPSIAPINAENSALLNALRQVRYRSAISGNKNPMGLALLPHNPVAGAPFLADRSEWVKSMLARALNAGKTQIPANVGRAVGGAIGAYEGEP